MSKLEQHSTPLLLLIHQIPYTACAELDAILAYRHVQVESVLVYENDNAIPAVDCPFTPGRDRWWQSEVALQPPTCAVEWVDAEHPLFLLYTSGSTGGS